MAERLLVGIDGLAASERALEWAIAREGVTELTILVVVDVPRTEAMFADFNASEFAQAERLVNDAKAHVLARRPEITVKAEAVPGDLVDVMEERSQDVDLVVIGAHDRTTLRGTRAIRIAATSAAPVILVPAESPVEERTGGGVVVGVDGSEMSERAIAFAAAEAARRGEPLIAVTAWHLPASFGSEYVSVPELAQALEEDAREASSLSLAGLATAYPDLVIERVIASGDAVTVLCDVGEDASLVVVGTRGRGPIRRLLLGSVSHSLLLRVHSPLAIVR